MKIILISYYLNLLEKKHLYTPYASFIHNNIHIMYKGDTMSKKIVVTLPDETYKIMKNLAGMGNKDGEIVRNLVISWMAEKSMISTSAKAKMNKKK
jgi:hypothetical protein